MKTYEQLQSEINSDVRNTSRSKEAIQRLLANDVNPNYDNLDDDELRTFWREVAEYATTLHLSIGVCA